MNSLELEQLLKHLSTLLKEHSDFDAVKQRLKILEELLKEQTLHENPDPAAGSPR